MASKSDAREERPLARPDDSEATDNPAEGYSRTRIGSEFYAPTVPSASGTYPQCTGNKAHSIIINIQATDVTRGLRRIPASFYIIVRHSGVQWRTENKSSSVDDDVCWNEPLPIPSNPSTTVCVEVCASFEFQPILGIGERLRRLTVTVQQLLDRSEKHVPFTFSPKDGVVVSPCSSIAVAIERRSDQSSCSSASKVLRPSCSTTNNPDGLEETMSHGHGALSRYRKNGEKRHLEYSVVQFERALNACPLNHPCRAIVQSNLAMARFILCQLDGANAPLDISLDLYRSALATRPIGHADRPSTVIQLAAVHLAKCKKQKIGVDGAHIVILLHEMMGLGTSHEKRAASFMLQLYASHRAGPDRVSGQSLADSPSGTRLPDEDPWVVSVLLLKRFERYGDLADLQEAIGTLQNLVRSVSVWTKRYSAGLGNLGTALWWRFNHLGELRDLEEAISTHTNAVRLTPDGHPDKLACLNNLGLCYSTRFKRIGELKDLEHAISIHRDTVRLTPNTHSDKPARLNNLGLSLRTRFERLRELCDLEEAISIHKDAVSLTPDDHLDRSGRLNNLGLSFSARFKHLGELKDLQDAISTHRDTVRLTPDGHPDKPGRLNNLGLSFITRFEHLGELRDLEDAISTHLAAVRLTPDGHSDKPAHLNNLASSFRARFSRLGELGDLEEAISLYRDAVRLTPDGHPDKLACLNNLGLCYRARFEYLGELRDLEDAISTHKDTIRFTPDGHPDKPGRLSNLGLSLRTRFKRLGELKDLEDAISTHRDVVRFTPDDHSDKLGCLDNLGYSLITRFERLGELKNLEDAISIHRDVVRLTPDDHPNKPRSLNNLGLSLRARFLRLGELRDLEDAISTHRDAVCLTPDGHLDKPGILNNLGLCFRARFERLGEPRDLEDAISTHRDAVRLTSDDHPDKPGRLNNLGNSSITRFQHFGEPRDLENAILTHWAAVCLIPDGHSDRPRCLNNLGLSFIARFSCLGELRDLENAISTHRDAIRLTPDGHPNKPSGLSNLGLSFRARFEYLGELKDLEDAISAHRDAVRLIPDGHPDKPGVLNNLGLCFKARFECLGEPRDLSHAVSLYSHSASFSTGSIRVRFQASQNWILCARRIHHPSLLRAYSIAIKLLPQLAWVGLSLAHRYAELKRGADLVREAAAAALDLGFPELAVKWLEQGRSIVWGELLQLRGSWDQLSSAYPDHAHRLRDLSAALDDASATREKSLSTILGSCDDAMYHATQTSQQEADRHRRLAIERDELLKDIRHLPGFRRFLLPSDFSQLCASAHSGPIVILNAAQTRCDALIILPHVDHAIHVPLTSFNFQRSVSLQNMLGKLLGHARIIPVDNRKGDPATRAGFNWESLLSTLWNGVIKPVLDTLAFSTVGELSRIFWCPTGPFTFLPLHAAGLYGVQHSSPGHKASDFVVSSYAPTLSTLTRSLNPTAPLTSDLRLLAVPQPPTDGQAPLRGVAPELRYIRTIVENSPSAHTTLVRTSVGTVEEVLGLMKDADWVHFACHGVQDDTKPTDSGLCLADGRRLKISDIIGLSRSREGLAFLSACQTAMGDEGLSDEAIHIAAGMLFAGYGGVIGTMWSISDRLAPVVARDVYKHLFRNGTRPDYREAAWALHEAVGRVRESGEESFTTWVPFIHVGL